MKTLKQLREEHNEKILSQVEALPNEVMLEGHIDQSKSITIPSSKEMPTFLTFRRLQYRIFPDRQVVALYYSKMIDKYLSIPFGPGGHANLSESIIYNSIEELSEDWQKVNRHDKTDGLSQKAVNAYRREHPGSKLQTAVTEKDPKGERANRRKSFCSRMGGMKKRLTSDKNARDPNSPINKALRRWNCEESFKQKLAEKRQCQEGIGSLLDAGAEAVVPYYSAGKKVFKGDYMGAAKDAAVDTALLATGAVAGKAFGAGAKVASKVVSKLKPASSVPRNMSKDLFKGKTTPSTKPGFLSKAKDFIKDKIAGVAGNVANPSNDAAKPSTSDIIDATKQTGQLKHTQSYRKSSWDMSHDKSQATRTSRLQNADQVYARNVLKPQVAENKMSDLRQMVDEGIEYKTLKINEREVHINTGMAKRILEVYDSVNSKNKKIVESMLNEDLESFKKLLNFSIRK